MFCIIFCWYNNTESVNIITHFSYAKSYFNIKLIAIKKPRLNLSRFDFKR